MSKVVLASITLALLTLACGKKKKDEEIPPSNMLQISLVESLNMVASVPTQSATSDAILQALVRKDVFDPSTSSSVYSLLTTFDSKVATLNEFAKTLATPNAPECLSSEPSSRSILTPNNDALSMYLNCSHSFDANSFMIFGKDESGTYYIYERSLTTVSIVKFTRKDSTSNSAVGSFTGFFSSNMSGGSNISGRIAYVSASQDEGVIKISAAYESKICGISIGIDPSEIHLMGSFESTTAGSCDAEANLAFAVDDFAASKTFNSAKLPLVHFKRKSGSATISGAVANYQEYANTSGAGNISLESQANPNINAVDLNFGPYTADELIAASF